MDYIKRNKYLNITDEKTFERECSPLLAIKDAYPKMIIARTHHEPYDYQGIYVNAPDKSSGKRRQHIHIRYDGL